MSYFCLVHASKKWKPYLVFQKGTDYVSLWCKFYLRRIKWNTKQVHTDIHSTMWLGFGLFRDRFYVAGVLKRWKMASERN